jgi:methylglutaconyl-CoA hydratase
MVNELTYFFKHEIENTTMNFVVLKGKGKSFCSGADLNDFSAKDPNIFVDGLNNLLLSISQTKIPVISIAHGRIFGGGLGLLAVSDIILADKDTLFSFTEVKLGLVPAIIAPYLEKKVTMGLLRYLMMSAQEFDMETAMKIGLVHQTIAVCEEKHSDTFINELLTNSRQAMQATKSLLNDFQRFDNIESKSSYAKNAILEVLKLEETQSRIKNFLRTKS